MADPTYTINFNNLEDGAKVSEKSREIIKGIMKKAEIYSMTVTSTARTVYDQARIMYDNIESTGVDAQKELYASAGDQVIDVYKEAKKGGNDRNTIISKMKAKIVELGAGSVSRHCADIEKLNVVDIAPSSIDAKNKSKFEDAIKNEAGISKYIFPPTDPAYHIEIPQ